MNYILYYLAVVDSILIKNCSGTAQKVKAVLGSAVFITGLSGFFSGGLVIYYIFNDIYSFCMGGLIWSFVIISFDRIIAASPKPDKIFSKSIFPMLIRFSIAILIGFFVSIPLETWILGDTITGHLDKKYAEQRKALYADEIAKLDQVTNEIANIDSEIESLEKKLSDVKVLRKAEEQGIDFNSPVLARKSSGIRGQGPRYTFYKEQVIEFEKQITTYKDKKKEKRKDFKTYNQQMQAYKKDDITEAYDLLARLTALEEIEKEYPVTKYVKWLLRTFFILIELLTILAKISLPETDYDHLQNGQILLNSQMTSTYITNVLQNIQNSPNTLINQKLFRNIIEFFRNNRP